MTETGKKAFVFSIDATLALMLLVFTLVTVSFLSVQAEDNPYARLQVVRAGKDALAVLAMQGVLGSGNATLVDDALNYTLPQGIGAHVQVSTYIFDTGAFNLVNVSDYGLSAPNNSSVYGARTDFVGMENGVVTNYSIARMSIWQK